MKKYPLIIIGILCLTGTAYAQCGLPALRCGAEAATCINGQYECTNGETLSSGCVIFNGQFLCPAGLGGSGLGGNGNNNSNNGNGGDNARTTNQSNGSCPAGYKKVYRSAVTPRTTTAPAPTRTPTSGGNMPCYCEDWPTSCRRFVCPGGDDLDSANGWPQRMSPATAPAPATNNQSRRTGRLLLPGIVSPFRHCRPGDRGECECASEAQSSKNIGKCFQYNPKPSTGRATCEFYGPENGSCNN